MVWRQSYESQHWPNYEDTKLSFESHVFHFAKGKAKS